MVDDSKQRIQDAKLASTARVALAMQRDPSLLARVTHELANADEWYPDLLARESISASDSVIATRDVNPRVVEYHLHGFQAIKAVIGEIKDVMPWACLPFSSIMLTLSRGFFPKLYSPNALYMFLSATTERALHDGLHATVRSEKDGGAGDVESIDDGARDAGEASDASDASDARTLDVIMQLERITAAVESALHVELPGIKIRFGPVVAPDLLASVSAYDDMVVIHPVAPASHCWPGIAATAIARLLLQKRQPKLDERLKDQLALLTNTAITGEPLLLPGANHDVLSRLPASEARDRVDAIASDLASRVVVDREPVHHSLLDIFPPASLGDNYSTDMIGSIITFIIDDNVDERELFARVAASNVGYRPFDFNYTLFQKAITMLEHAGFMKRSGDDGKVLVIDSTVPNDGTEAIKPIKPLDGHR